MVAALAAAFAGAGARVLDTHVDGDHNRAVITLVGDDREVQEGLVAGIEEAARHVDLRTHDGVHPRVGAADVVPVVPLAAADLGRAVDVALVVGARVGDELGFPVFLYGEIGDGRRPAFFRRGGPGELQRRVDAGELEPAFGPRRLDPAAGAVLLGVRAPLVAFNLELRGRSTSPATLRLPCASRPEGCPASRRSACASAPDGSRCRRTSSTWTRLPRT